MSEEKCQMTVETDWMKKTGFPDYAKCGKPAKFVTKHFPERQGSPNFFICGLHARSMIKTRERLIKRFGPIAGNRPEIKQL